MTCKACRLLQKLGMATDSESSEEGMFVTPEQVGPVPSGSSRTAGQPAQPVASATGHLPSEADTAGGLLKPGESIPTWDEVVQMEDFRTTSEDGGPSMEPYLGHLVRSPAGSDAGEKDNSPEAAESNGDRETMWLRREEPSASASAAPEQREWLRISGSEEVMEAFRQELLASEPLARVYTPAVIRAGTTRVHQVTCTLVCANQRFTHVMCPSCTSSQNMEDRLVADTDKTVHSTLACRELHEVAQGRILGYCGICWFQGLGPASNIPPTNVEDLEETTPSPSDVAGSDPPSPDVNQVAVGSAGG